MYNSITGTFTGLVIQGTQTLVLVDQGGLEWQIEASRSTLAGLPSRGERVKLLLHLHHTEDSMSLFGFSTTEERQLFLQLQKVQGIGPRAAIRILSGTTPRNLARLLETGDLEGLERIPGLGKKTSQKVLLTLKGKLVLDDGTDAAPGMSLDAEMVQALVDMGFERKDAQREVARIAATLDGMPPREREQELLRQAIIALSKA